MALDTTTVTDVTDRLWGEALPALVDYIRIPAKSPAFDAAWADHGYIQQAVDLIVGWCRPRLPEDATIEVVELAGKTPVVVMDVPAHGRDTPGTVLLYGHLDKQPEMVGWAEGKGPWTPVIENDRLYGRGGADDGYSAFAAVTALAATREAGGAHPRCVVLIEASEESGSPDLPAYLEHLAPTLGDVSLVVCLDSGAGDYDHLWVTTSLRGLVSAHLRVDVLTEGVHSGSAGGAVPSSMRVMRQILDRLEDAATGRVLVSECHVEIPQDAVEAAHAVADAGLDIRNDFPWAGSTEAMQPTAADLLLATTWEPSLSYVGIDGIPSVADGGNVLRPFTTLGLSFRLPPTCDARAAGEAIRAIAEADPPAGATVTCDIAEFADGWAAPAVAPWLAEALTEASVGHFGANAKAQGLGGSIPFMGMLGERYPDAQFVITGVLGPGSNAHGPNEFLHLPTARRITAAMASVLDAASR